MSLKEYTITNRSFFSIGPHLLGLIFIAVGLFTIASPLFMPGSNSAIKSASVGTLAVIFGLMVVSSYNGTTFDFTSNRYKKFYALSGFKLGKWEPLPAFRLIKVFPHTFTTKTSANGVNPSATIQVTQYTLALYTNHPKPFMSFHHDDMDRTLKEAQLLSSHFKTALDIQLSSK